MATTEGPPRPGPSTTSSTWAECMRESAFLLTEMKTLLDSLARDEDFLMAVGASSRQYRSQMMAVFGTHASNTAKGKEQLSALIIIVLIAGTTKRKRRALQMVETLVMKGTAGASLASTIIGKLPERQSQSGSSPLPALPGIAAAFPEIVTHHNALLRGPHATPVRFEGKRLIPCLRTNELAQLN